MSDLAELEEIAGAMLRRLAAPERRRVMRAIVRDLATAQSRQIGAQKAPDGSPFPARRTREAAAPGRYSVRFLYPKGSPSPRIVLMKNWARQGPLITGFDIEAGAVRSFFWDKIDKWLPLEPGDALKSGGTFRRRGRIRRQTMFRKLRNRRNLRSGVSDRESWIGFAGRASEIARIHHEGRRDQPSQKAKPIRYPQRELLGLTAAHRSRILDLLLDHIG